MKGTSKVVVRTALASGLALALVACGGGGGNTKSDPPPVSPPPTSPPPVSPPPTSPPPSPPPTPQPATNAHLAITNTLAAHAKGYTGAGYRIGVVDSGINRNHPALAGRVVANYTYVDPAKNNTAKDDVVGHGTVVAELAAGAATGSWPGGVAPGAQLVSARIIADESPKDDGSGDGNEVDGALGLAGIHQDLIRAGVKIMNNSWGGLYWTNPNATAAIAAEYRPFISSNGGLVVFATGNEGKANPSDMAALPSQAGPNGTSPAADLERGWLAVAAVDTANPSELASYSNACGIAKNYCLVAPGTAMFVGADSTASNLSYFYGSGTSYAAPLVSGAAALVWQAYPYFSNDLVRQTLLGTATDLGAAGVDDVFGYGLLNVGKAINGPGRFDWGDVSVSFTGTSAWHNAITGSGGLIKNGSGTLVLGEAGTVLDYRGDTRVQQGVLNVAGRLTTSNVQVGSAGRLAQTAWLGGNLTNAGVVEIDAAGATNGGLQVAGNYVQQTGGRLAMTLGNGQLQVGGTATVQGGDVHVLGVRSGYVTQAREYVLTANGGLTGRFDGLTAASGVFLDAALGYSATQAWMDISRLNVSATAATFGSITPAALGSAARVETAFAQIDAQQSSGTGRVAEGLIRVAGGLQALADEAAAVRALESLSGSAHAASMAMTFDSIDMNRRALAQQVGSSTPASYAWSQRLGAGGGGYSGSGFQMDGWLLGNQLNTGGGTRLGVAFGQTQAAGDATVSASPRNLDRHTHAQLYAGVQGAAGYVLAQAGGGQFQRSLQRQLELGGTSANTLAQYDGQFVNASVEVGHRFEHGNTAITPYAGASYAQLRGDGFDELGGEGFGLRTDAWRSARTQLLGGVRADYARAGVMLSGYAEWQQAVARQGQALQASFTGVQAWAPLSGLQPGQSGGLVGVSLRSQLSPSSFLNVGWDQRFGGRVRYPQASVRYLWQF